MFKGKTEVDPKDKESLLEGFAWLNDFLKGNKWVAGDELSIADFSIVGTVSAFFVSSFPDSILFFPSIII